jgi:excisionase family DNA binding protein
MNSNPDVTAAAREMAKAFAKILEIFIKEAQRTLSAIASRTNQQIPAPQPKEPALEGWVDRKQLAKHLCICQRTLSTWMAKGRLPHVKLGRSVRFRLEDVDAHLRRTQRGGW